MDTTFGVELEFVLLYPRTVDRPLSLVRNALSQPVSYKCDVAGCLGGTHEYRLPVHDYFGARYSHHGVTYDSSVEFDFNEAQELPKDYKSVGIELVTRVLNFDKPTCFPDDVSDPHGKQIALMWQDEVQVLLRLLFEGCRESGALPVVHRSAGFHVHVGNKRLMSLSSAKNIMAVFTAFEKQLDAILPLPRISGYSGRMDIPCHTKTTSRAYNYPISSRDRSIYDVHGHYSTGLSKLHFERVQRYREDLNAGASEKATRSACLALNVPAWLSIIMRVQDIEELVELYTVKDDPRGHYSALNLDNLLSPKKTIEVRMHGASLDLDEISSWVDTVVNMFETCTKVSPIEMLLAKWESVEYTFADFVQDMGASPKSQAFYKTMLSTDYSQKRYTAAMGRISYDHPLSSFVQRRERVRCTEFTRLYVQEKIRHKFESGLYGTQPVAMVRHMLNVDKLDDNALPLVVDASEILLFSRQATEAALTDAEATQF